MSHEIANAFQKVIDRKLLDAAYPQLSFYIEKNCARLDLTYNARNIENVDQATLLDFELVRVDSISQHDSTLIFRVIVNAEIEIEETIRRDREVECIHKWFVLNCVAEIDDVADSFSVNSVDAY